MTLPRIFGDTASDNLINCLNVNINQFDFMFCPTMTETPGMKRSTKAKFRCCLSRESINLNHKSHIEVILQEDIRDLPTDQCLVLLLQYAN